MGLDRGGAIHALLDAAGALVDRFQFDDDREDLAVLISRLRKRCAPGDTPIAIERLSGLLVDTLVEAGFVVTLVQPNVVNSCRPHYRAVAAKSDPGDAYILADLLRTNGHRLTALKPQSDATKSLRALVQGRDDLVATRLVLAKQLRAPLDSFWSDAAALFADIASPIALACFADHSRHALQWAADVYKHARARGDNHAHATRILARAWIRILWRAWQDDARYDPAKHPAARAFNAASPQPG